MNGKAKHNLTGEASEKIRTVTVPKTNLVSKNKKSGPHLFTLHFHTSCKCAAMQNHAGMLPISYNSSYVCKRNGSK